MLTDVAVRLLDHSLGVAQVLLQLRHPHLRLVNLGLFLLELSFLVFKADFFIGSGGLDLRVCGWLIRLLNWHVRFVRNFFVFRLFDFGRQ